MNPVDVTCLTIWEDTGVFLMARMLGNAGTPVTQGTLSTILLNVFDLTDDGDLVYTTNPTISSDVFDTLQTADPRWTADAVGYNFGTTVPPEAFPEGRHEYRLEIVFTPTAGGKFALVVDVNVRNLRSS